MKSRKDNWNLSMGIYQKTQCEQMVIQTMQIMSFASVISQHQNIHCLYRTSDNIMIDVHHLILHSHRHTWSTSEVKAIIQFCTIKELGQNIRTWRPRFKLQVRKLDWHYRSNYLITQSCYVKEVANSTHISPWGKQNIFSMYSWFLLLESPAFNCYILFVTWVIMPPLDNETILMSLAVPA